MTPIARGRWSDIGYKEATAIGAAGEAAVAAELAAAGFHVYVPAFGSPEADLIAEMNGKLIRLQVKALTGADEVLNFYPTQSSKRGYDGSVDYIAFLSLHHGVTAYMKPEEVGAKISLRYDTAPKHPNVTMNFARDYPLERVIKEITQ